MAKKCEITPITGASQKYTSNKLIPNKLYNNGILAVLNRIAALSAELPAILRKITSNLKKDFKPGSSNGIFLISLDEIYFINSNQRGFGVVMNSENLKDPN